MNEDVAKKLLAAMEAMHSECQELRDAVRRIEERLPPLTGAQRAARHRESRRRNADVTQFSEEKVTQPSRTSNAGNPTPLPVPPPSFPPLSPPSFNPPPDPKTKSMSTSVDVVFSEWQRLFGKPTARLTPERERKIRARLKDYPIERVLQALRGCRKSPYHQGQNESGRKYDDIELICRDGKHLEMFEAMAPKINGTAVVQRQTDEEILAEVNAEFEGRHGRVQQGT